MLLIIKNSKETMSGISFIKYPKYPHVKTKSKSLCLKYAIAITVFNTIKADTPMPLKRAIKVTSSRGLSSSLRYEIGNDINNDINPIKIATAYHDDAKTKEYISIIHSERDVKNECAK